MKVLMHALAASSELRGALWEDWNCAVQTGKLDGKVETENPSLIEFISRRVSRLRRKSVF
jgi:hypothetical protein